MNCLDSSFLIDLSDAEREHHGAAQRWLRHHQNEPFFAPTFVLYEVLRGVARALGPEAVEQRADDLNWLEPIPLTMTAAKEAAKLDGELHADGKQVNVRDRLIAGVVRDAGGTLITRDREFDRISGLSVRFYA